MVENKMSIELHMTRLEKKIYGRFATFFIILLEQRDIFLPTFVKSSRYAYFNEV
jgi:hypothetical protein